MMQKIVCLTRTNLPDSLQIVNEVCSSRPDIGLSIKARTQFFAKSARGIRSASVVRR